MTSHSKSSSRSWISSLICGICMGAADLIPGISGGTIAFVMGFYQELISSLKNVNAKSFLKFLKKQDQSGAWKFLSGLGLGMMIALGSLVHVFSYLLGHPVFSQFLYASFFGLILASTLIFTKKISVWTGKHLVMFFIGITLSFIFTNLEMMFTASEPLYDVPYVVKGDALISNYNPTEKLLVAIPEKHIFAMVSKKYISAEDAVYSLSDKEWIKVSEIPKREQPWISPWLIFCGAIAISAMLLPGISGSYLLTVLGVYSIVIASLSDFIMGLTHLSWERESFQVLANLSVGIIMGALVFSRVITWLFKNYECLTIVLLTGFMLGAMRTIWPFWEKALVLNPLKLDKGPILQPFQPVFFPSSTIEGLIAIGICVLSFMAVRSLELRAQSNQGLK